MESYIKIETEDKKRIVSLIEEALEQNTGSRIYTHKLSNGSYEVEVMTAVEEQVSSS